MSGSGAMDVRAEDRGGLASLLTEALGSADLVYADQLAAKLQHAYGQDDPGLAREVGASLETSIVGGLEPAHALGYVTGVVQRYFADQEPPPLRLTSLLEGLYIGYVGALQNRLNSSQTGGPNEDETETGRNHEAISDCNCLSSQMDGALERGEFFLVYQPIVRLSDRNFIGAEALLRWEHPTLGTLLPGQFLDLAEDNGVIAPLTAFVIEQACRHVLGWRKDGIGPQPFISVNVSASTIYVPGFFSMVEKAFMDTGLPGDALQLELTEHANLGRDKASVAQLRELSALGLSLAIDDFGTGFSSLAYLRNLPVNVVKLAGEFIENLGNDRHDWLADEQIIRAVIDLAHTLGLTVTAEQVETPRQAAQLRDLGCDTAQGWHLAKELPADFFSG